MTKEERAVIQAARALVEIKQVGRITTANVSQDPQLMGELIKAVVQLENNGGYWATR